MATFTYNFDTRVITVDAPFVTTTCQELLNDIRDVEDELLNLDDDQIAVATGKQDLGGGLQVGIVLELVNNWKLAFEARAGPATELMTVTGGNLIGRDTFGAVVFPISPTAFTAVTIAQSSSATIVTPETLATGSVQAGSTATVINTDRTEADNHFDGAWLIITNAAGRAGRFVESYSQTSGAFTVSTDFPFTPAAGDAFSIVDQGGFARADRANTSLIPATL